MGPLRGGTQTTAEPLRKPSQAVSEDGLGRCDGVHLSILSGRWCLGLTGSIDPA